MNTLATRLHQLPARAHIKILENAELLMLCTAVAIFFGRLIYTAPHMAVTCFVLVIVTHSLHSSLRKRQGLTWRVALSAAAFVVASSILMSAPAEALSFGGMAKNLKSDLGSIYDAIVYGCYGLGIVGGATGINNAIKRSKGDTQVTTASIFGYGLGGPALAMVGYMMDSASESMTGSTGNYNKLPGGL